MPPKAEEKKADAKADAKGGGKDAGKAGGKGKGKGKGKGDDIAQPKMAGWKPAGGDDDDEIGGGSKRKDRKNRYAVKLRDLLKTYKNCLICKIDFVGSNQMQQVRLALRGKGELIMGKNTVVRKIVREEAQSNPKLLNLLPEIQGNVGFCFTNGKLPDLRKVIQSNRVPAPARSNTFAPDDVFIPAGPTGLDPGQTAFFQTLNIATKIARGSIEIINQVHLVKKGEKVNSSHVALLAKLDLKPFSYGVIVTHAYENGACYEAKVLDWSMDDIFSKWIKGVAHVAALSLAAGHPTLASIAHSISNGFRKLVAISLETSYTFEQAKIYKEMVENPDAFKKEEAEEAGGDEGGEKEAEKEEESAEEESDGQIGGGLFGGED
jgi:large subunit ribosomal protein LP0